jgi:hypothetical protein
MIKKSLAILTTGLLALGTAASAQSNSTGAPQSQSTASGSGNSASQGTESNSDQPDIANAARHSRQQSGADKNKKSDPNQMMHSGNENSAGPDVTKSQGPGP